MKDFADFEMEIQNQRVLVDTIPNELLRQVILQPIPDKGAGGRRNLSLMLGCFCLSP